MRMAATCCLEDNKNVTPRPAEDQVKRASKGNGPAIVSKPVAPHPAHCPTDAFAVLALVAVARMATNVRLGRCLVDSTTWYHYHDRGLPMASGNRN
jgi:hypothetical protein